MNESSDEDFNDNLIEENFVWVKVLGKSRTLNYIARVGVVTALG